MSLVWMSNHPPAEVWKTFCCHGWSQVREYSSHSSNDPSASLEVSGRVVLMEPISLHQFWLHLEWSYELLPVAINSCDRWVGRASNICFSYSEKIVGIQISIIIFLRSELKTLEWDILNPDRLINLEINNKRRTSII